jgi:hypothetical protein
MASGNDARILRPLEPFVKAVVLLSALVILDRGALRHP